MATEAGVNKRMKKLVKGLKKMYRLPFKPSNDFALAQIASVLSGIQISELTTAESQIFKILLDAGVAAVANKNSECVTLSPKAKSVIGYC